MKTLYDIIVINLLLLNKFIIFSYKIFLHIQIFDKQNIQNMKHSHVSEFNRTHKHWLQISKSN